MKLRADNTGYNIAFEEGKNPPPEGGTGTMVSFLLAWASDGGANGRERSKLVKPSSFR